MCSVETSVCSYSTGGCHSRLCTLVRCRLIKPIKWQLSNCWINGLRFLNTKARFQPNYFHTRKKFDMRRPVLAKTIVLLGRFLSYSRPWIEALRLDWKIR
ncbi:hypothetical protein T07_1500 [Trichinella nelsoni]|uniref:Uncharacterized protein n=1 Tax=Trichinella nelsoni TaxID=6336 RepID=A0A0V0S7K4_9BILA|nr:hypothetical protein T07_1500 [Trichinella nelsoni]